MITRRCTFRLYLSKAQAQKLSYWRRLHKDLYNAALYNRKTQYQRFGKSVTYYDQQDSLPEFKKGETGDCAIGVDFGTLTAIAMSDGTKIENPRFLSATSKKIRVASKQKRRKRAPNFKKKVLGSKRWKKAQSKVSKLLLLAANQRQDWGHKVTTQIVSSNSMVVTEQLNIKGMTKKPKKGKRKRQKTGLNRSILDVGWGILGGMLEYKLGEADGVFLEAPTKTLKPSQRCPNCWEVKPKTLAERIHQCPCGCIEDRDVASAQVCLLWATGLGTSLDKRGSQASTGKPTTKHCGGFQQAWEKKRQKPSEL